MAVLQPSSDPEGFATPTIIVLCTWTGAQKKYIEKYKHGYMALFPGVKILVVKTSLQDLCFCSSQSKQKKLKTDVDDISEICQQNGRILLHVFSDGGSNKACELAEAYLKNKQSKMPVAALCLDSTPGTPRFARLCNAMRKVLIPLPFLGPVAGALSVAAVGALWGFYYIVGFDSNVITTTRKRLLNEKTWDMTTPRCYLYSEADEEVYWGDIQSHAQDSRGKGTPIFEVMFGGSQHVKHGYCEPGKYWNAVRTIWKYRLLGYETEGVLNQSSLVYPS